MKKRGFTLIELLAVIVILAIIVLIAAPVVVDIIGDSKKDGIINGASLYLKAVDLSIAEKNKEEGLMPEGTFKLTKEGNVCLDDKCENKLIVKTTGNIPKGGTITIENSSVTGINFEYDGATVVLNDRGVPEFADSKSDSDSGSNEEETILKICKLVSGTEKQPGAKYECEVKEGTKYNFYVLGNNDNGTTSLVMDKNIVEDIHWLTKVDYESIGGPSLTGDQAGCSFGPALCSSATYGPVTAMNALYNATKGWDKVSNIKINYTDDSGYSYSIKTDSTTTTINKTDGTVITSYENLKARMITKAELDLYSSSAPNIVSGSRYWTLSVKSSDTAYTSNGEGYITHNSPSEGQFSPDAIAKCQPTGVRPVIEIKL